MNLVWPLTALWAGVFGLLLYLLIGRNKSSSHRSGSFWEGALVGTLHCGAGCTLGDLVAEAFGAMIPLHVFEHKTFDAWIIDYIAAFIFGVAFQYFSIRQTRNLSFGSELLAALKADAASLTSWQLGMYGWMAITLFVLFSPDLPKSSMTFWFMMQIAMLFGLATAYPVNCWLLRAGIKEQM
ncbi:DUF4396 domain-containing protein [Solimonas marina]|nr:DUF4396 domain-containing protein [Solimonas marina]